MEVEMSITYHCERCGKEYEPKRATSRFCSYECYWASGEPAKNIKRKPYQGAARYARVYLGRDEQGKPKYIQRSRYVWNQHHPDDQVQPGEHIHHIDHNSRNDDPANLTKMVGGEHQGLHANGIP